VVVIPSVGARRHAEKVAAWGADAVLVQGGEGGGHTGRVATTVLLPQVVDAVDIPVIAAGGFFDGRGLVAALAYGAAGIAMGTRFLLTSDSTVPDAVKARYLAASAADIVVTTKVDGLPHRMLRSELTEALERSGPAATLVRALRHAASFRRLSGTGWTEQSATAWP
jgi:NAD(P)H-dependent flavin oxidoreductase YrpB (nitropropane dioxygenase family)